MIDGPEKEMGMTIDEAIKELTKIVGKWQYGADSKRDKALQLGIEALRRVRDYKKAHIGLRYTPMPGETEE